MLLYVKAAKRDIFFGNHKSNWKWLLISAHAELAYMFEEREESRAARTLWPRERGKNLIIASGTMYLDSNLRLEVLSSLLDKVIKPYNDRKCGGTEDVLSVGKFLLCNLFREHHAYVKEFFIDEKDFFDPSFDFDFTHLSDSSECMRGGEIYKRPKGWYRLALKVKGKYPDGDTWLGTKGWRNHSVPGEWPVSYHGTSLKGAKGIIKSHYSAGDRDLYGRGIYSTPDIHAAEEELYAKTFTSKTTRKSYKVIVQNRINPEEREICQQSNYWLIPVHKRASAAAQKRIAESSIRPYGILIKEIKWWWFIWGPFLPSDKKGEKT